MKIQVYKCRFTGAIFDFKDRNKYIKHLKDVRADMKAKRRDENIRLKFDKWLAKEKENIVHVDMIVPWILENQKYLMNAVNAIYRPTKYDKFYSAIDEITQLTTTFVYNKEISNSHSCPHNGVTNWGGRIKNAPRGYPGWSGYVNGVLKRDEKHMSSYPISSLFKLIRIHTGSGGGGNKNWGFHAEVFLADWPGLEQELTINKLKYNKC